VIASDMDCSELRWVPNTVSDYSYRQLSGLKHDDASCYVTQPVAVTKVVVAMSTLSDCFENPVKFVDRPRRT
jgi:hypothetical protein